MGKIMHSVKFGIVVMMVAGVICSCSGKKFRSPIVFRSPVVTDEPKPQKADDMAAQSVLSPQEDASAQTSASTSSPYEVQEITPVPGDAYREEPSSDLKASAPVSTPADIPIFSDQQLEGATYYVLGKIEVSAFSERGFTGDEAIQELKVEAFKRYGSQVQGIANIEHKAAAGLLFGEGDTYKKVSGEAIVFSSKGDEGGQAPSMFSGADIRVFTSDELVNLRFRVVGSVTVRYRSEQGLGQEQVIQELKNAAARQYGTNARGITNLVLVKKSQVFYYTKVRRNISSPKAPDTYDEASAEVISWD